MNILRSVKCKIKDTNKGLGKCMAQELTSPLHRWGYHVPITGGWSNYDYKCSTETNYDSNR